jgi:hypothetical protein
MERAASAMTIIAPPNSSSFLTWVQEHERAWGNLVYGGRPTLEEILNAPVVVFWRRTGTEKPDRYFVITLHSDLAQLEKYFARILLLSFNDPPRSQVAAIFQEQRQMRIAEVHVRFEPVEQED